MANMGAKTGSESMRQVWSLPHTATPGAPCCPRTALWPAPYPVSTTDPVHTLRT